MSEKVKLKAMKCPTCGGALNAENNTDAIVCVYCGNTIVPVTEAPATARSMHANDLTSGLGSVSVSGTVRVEGIKTSASALAYMEQFFEEYDWEAFVYAQTLSIAETDKLATSLKTSSSDDKNTWILCFRAVSTPYLRKIEGCGKILSAVIEEYKRDNLDAYSKFDAYKRIVSMIVSAKEALIAKLDKFIGNATRYGASADELAALRADAQAIGAAQLQTYDRIEDIPDIRAFTKEKNAQIARDLAADGINADAEYMRAKSLLEGKKYAEALDVLLSLRGYSDSAALARKIDRYYLISNVLEIEDKLYYFKTNVAGGAVHLYPTELGKIASRPIITDIGSVLTNYADVLYYLDVDSKLTRYSLSSNQKETIYEKRLTATKVFGHDRHIFLLEKKEEGSSASTALVELDLARGTVKSILENVQSMVSMTDENLVYTAVERSGESDQMSVAKSTYIFNVDTQQKTAIGTAEVSVEGFVDHCVVYTKKAPNEYNRALYVKMLGSDKPETLVEQNIFKFCDIVSGKLFYYVGNTKKQSLININPDGTERREWPLYISKVLFEQGGWLYFIRRVGYNSLLCKSLLDGSKFSIIAADIDRFVEIKNGYLYYINFSSTLVKVRMDGSNLQVLCEDVETVLTVKEDKIVFVSVDDGIVKSANLSQGLTKAVKSIYAVDFSGSGKIKLAYDVDVAQPADEGFVYYTATESGVFSYNPSKGIEILYRLDVETNQTERLLELELQAEKSLNRGFIIAMVITAVTILLGIIGFADGARAFGSICVIIAIISLIVGLAVWATRNVDD